MPDHGQSQHENIDTVRHFDMTTMTVLLMLQTQRFIQTMSLPVDL